MNVFLRNCIEAFRDDEPKDRAAAQGTVPAILLISGFAVVAVLVTMWIGNSIAWQANLQARCISQMDGFNSFNGNPNAKCIGAEDGVEYKGRNILNNQINATKGERF